MTYSKDFGEILDEQLRVHMKANNIILSIITDLEKQIQYRGDLIDQMDNSICKLGSTVDKQHTEIHELKMMLRTSCTDRMQLIDNLLDEWRTVASSSDDNELPRFVVELPNAECVYPVVNMIADAVAKSSGHRFNIQFYVPEGDRDD